MMSSTDSGNHVVTGYGPSMTRNRLIYNGDESKFELWLEKFRGHLRLQKLLPELNLDEPDVEKNACIYAELVMLLDDKSLSLVIRDAKDDGKKALGILTEHYLGKSKPRIISLYGELASMEMNTNENVTDYVIRAETAATSLKTAGETISDSLLIAMCMKGLPSSFNSFSTVIAQKDDKMDFVKFKYALRSFEEAENSRNKNMCSNDNVMNVSGNKNRGDRPPISCFKCGKLGHKASACRGNWNSQSNRGKSSRYCSNCKNNSHDTKYCRNNSAKSVRNDYEDEHSFAFKTVVLNVAEQSMKTNDWLLVDCGATSHIVCNRERFVSFDKNFDAKAHCIELADGSRSNQVVEARGKAIMHAVDSTGKSREISLNNALFIPSYSQNIFSVNAATENGASLMFTKTDAKLRAGNGTDFDLVKRGRLYYLYNAKSSNVVTKSLREWHAILGHCNVQDILKMESCVQGMVISEKNTVKNFKCNVCLKGKMVQYHSKVPDEKATSPLDFVHCDIAGPMDPVARDGFRYAINFVDDFSGLIFIYFLKGKDDAPRAFEQFLADSAPYGTVKRLRSDNAKEFLSKNFRDILLKNKIKHETSCYYSPSQNGSAERSFRTIFEMARCILVESGMPKNLWAYAARAAAFIRNRCFNPRTQKTAYESFTLRKPKVNKMEVFGKMCFAYVQHKKKLDERCQEGRFVGFDVSSPSYLVYFPLENAVRKVRCVEFGENSNVQNEGDDFDEIEPYVTHGEQNVPNHETVTLSSPMNNVPRVPPPITDIKISERYPKRDRKRPQRYDEYVMDDDDEFKDCVSKMHNLSIDFCYRISEIPSSYQDAIVTPESSHWVAAMQEELNSLSDNKTFTLTAPPKGAHVIGGRWVFSVKPGTNNEVKYKARYVAKGFSQKWGRDYDETFSPTAKMTTIRMLIQIAAKSNFYIHQLDVKSAYLHADMDYELYVKQPQGFVERDGAGNELVWLLNKSLYGLKQAGRNWNALLDSFLKSQNFVPSLADPCLYTRFENNSIVFVLVWVDDMIICSNIEKDLIFFKGILSKRFKMKDLGILSWFLGIQFTFENDCIRMSQSDFVGKVVEKFSMNDAHPRKLPCDFHTNKFDFEDSPYMEDARLYREIVGSLIYIMTCTRPDLSYVVTKLSQYMAKPRVAHLTVAKNALRYLKGTVNSDLRFATNGESVNLVGFCDSDYAGSEDRKSISGYCFKMCENGPLVSWKTKKQSTVSLSSCEAEYTAFTYAVQEGKFLAQLLSDLKNEGKETFPLFVDNQAAMKLATNPVYHQRSKHIDVKFHFVRHEVKENVVQFFYIPSKKNVADIFTKSVSLAQMDDCNIFGK